MTRYLLMLILSTTAVAQMPIGTVSNVQPAACIAGMALGDVCSTATVSCPGLPDVQAIWGVKGTGTAGTISLLNGNGDVVPGGSSYASKYTKAGFALVQIAFTTSWQVVGGNLLTSVCRPATMLAYFETQNGAPYCAHGISAGSGAVAYSMSWYGVQFDNVEFNSGPVFSNILEGCEVPYASPVTVNPTNGLPFVDNPQYNVESGSLSQWTGKKCLPKLGTTSTVADAAWVSQSIIQPTAQLSFPTTTISAWDCDNGLNPSAAQSYLFVSNLTTPWNLTRLSGCMGAEGTSPSVTPQGIPAATAIADDMIQQCVKHPSPN